MKFLNETKFSDFITDKIPRFSTYILADGRFVDLYDGTHRAFIQYCNEEGISYREHLNNSIQCNDGKSYIDEMPYAYVELPKLLTANQYSSLLKWLDKLDFDDEVEILVDGNYKRYSLIDYTTDEIIKKIRRYYSSGTLYEAKKRNK